jgi:hypothetical protein
MARFEQYEVWEFNHGKWEMIAAFREFDVANALVHHKRYRVRLVRAVYEGGKPVQQDILTEIGATRRQE